VQSDGGFYEESESQTFSLRTDSGGVARKECPDSMCFGTRSGLRFTDTFDVHQPFWRFRIVAEHYEPIEWSNLNTIEHVRQTRSGGEGRTKLILPASLCKNK